MVALSTSLLFVSSKGKVMEATKHTPAPWFVSHDGVFGGYYIDDEYADLEGMVDPSLEELAARKGANASLIAAAPELLEALQEVKANVAYTEFDDELWDRIDTAITKAQFVVV